MIIISVHGRSGQGVESTLTIIANSLLGTGLNVQTLFFPASEKRGSYTHGLIKADKAPLLSRQTETSDITLIFDTSLQIKEILSNAKEKSMVLFNSKDKLAYPELKKKHLKGYVVDATGISIAAGAKALPNLSMLGALAKNFNKITMKNIKSASETFAKDGGLLIEEGYKNVKLVK
jgi:Pyruvate/2-oxoacid:ferredoxin oxidoreductase gamma subunit